MSDEQTLTKDERWALALMLHAPRRLYQEFRFKPWCEECSQGFTAGGDDGPPTERRVYWPCRTARLAGLTDPLDPVNQEEEA